MSSTADRELAAVAKPEMAAAAAKSEFTSVTQAEGVVSDSSNTGSSRPGCGYGTFKSLKRMYNWRQSIKPLQAKAEEMEVNRHRTVSAGVKRYYRNQLHLIEQYAENDELQRKASVHACDERDENAGPENDDVPLVHTHEIVEIPPADSDEDNALIAWATKGSLALNIVLFILKIFLVVRSGSMAFVASLVDSALDLFSGAVMVAVSYLISHSKEENFPTGKHKFEAIGTLIFACAMFIASSKVIEECVSTLVDIENVRLTMEELDYFFIGFVIVSKAVAFILCRKCANVSATIEALADDHRNDVLTNSCAVIAVFAARYFSKYFDPAIGLATAVFMMWNWAATAFEQATALSGRAASPEYVSLLTMIARNHDPRVLAIDTVRAVTSGSGHMVEIDLLLPSDMTLVETHDIGERLQVFLENCEPLEITRAYVHLDYETDHKPSEHR